MAYPLSFPVVGVGASAGGVEALEGLFRGMPAEPGVAIVVVTHLNPERTSVLHEIIGRYTELPVEVAKDGAEVRENAVYVAPSDATLGISNGRLQVHRSDVLNRERKPIDVFLSALALDQGESSASIILSGLDGDGTLGSKAVKERGGLTIAQTANGYGPSHADMPESAIATGLIDFAIPALEMGPKLAEFARSMSMLDGLTAASIDADEERAWHDARQEIYAILRTQIGHDFGGYKPKTFLRRVQRRMQVLQSDSVVAYLERLRQDPKEVSALFRDLLINVTNFFRDADAFEKLREFVVPKLFEGKGAEDTVRVWVPGCATGEEVFSIAILMREYMEGLSAVPRIQIFATDIDERSLAVARAGRYPRVLLDSITDERRRRYFIADGASFVVNKDVRDLCVFSPHSVIRDPPFSRIDLVSCRNLLIYFGVDIQNQVIPIFHYSLRAGGYLFLGPSENVNHFAEMFTPLEKQSRIFRKRAGMPARLPTAIQGLLQSAGLGIGPPARSRYLPAMAWRQSIESQVLERFGPAFVVTTRDGEIIHYSANTGKYLEQVAGPPNQQLLTIARRGLRYDLRMAFREAIDTGRTIVRRQLAIETDVGQSQLMSLTVAPINDREEGEALLLFVFRDDASSESDEMSAPLASSPEGMPLRLESELAETKQRLQSLIEEYETALEELKSSNEELVSVNEEMQSTNEELEASKEELQSLNEELHTVNLELSGKVEALDRANADLHNLFESTQVATVFLDRNLVIRSFTPAVTRIFNILPSDRGRPITDLASRLVVPTLARDVKAVLEGGAPIENRIDHEDRAGHFLVRIVSYRDVGQHIDGVTVTFIDVTTIALVEAHQRTLIAELNHRVKNMLTVAIGIAEQTFKSAASPVEFKTGFVARLRAMARSYELLSRENWTEAYLRDLIKLELEPFGADRISIEGPAVNVKPTDALSIGMVFHELVTNAAKYGALSVPEGRLAISWSVTTAATAAGSRQLNMTWTEIGGPETASPAHRGFGLKLIEREVGFSLGGTSEIDFQKDGLKVTMVFPLA